MYTTKNIFINYLILIFTDHCLFDLVLLLSLFLKKKYFWKQDRRYCAIGNKKNNFKNQKTKKNQDSLIFEFEIYFKNSECTIFFIF